MTKVVGILLAAGFGVRFGADKRLQPLDDGRPVAIVAAQNLLAALSDAIAVVRPEDGMLRHELAALGMKVVLNSRASEGMGASLALAVQALKHDEACLVALADMPWIKPYTIAQLRERLIEGAQMVAPVHRGRRGHPVGFSPEWSKALRNLRGDQGARSLLLQHGGALTLFETGDAGVLRDIDRPADLGVTEDSLSA